MQGFTMQNQLTGRRLPGTNPPPIPAVTLLIYTLLGCIVVRITILVKSNGITAPATYTSTTSYDANALRGFTQQADAVCA